MNSVLYFGLVAVVVAVDWSNCGGLKSITSITASPDPPQRGRTNVITAAGKLAVDVSGGQFEIQVTVSGIKLLDKKGNVCSGGSFDLPFRAGTVHIPGLSCPYKASTDTSINIEISVKSWAPKGSIKAVFKATDTSGHPLVCVEVNSHVGVANNLINGINVTFAVDCNNSEDITAFKKHRNDFHSIAKNCAKKYWGSPVPTAHCLMSMTGNTLPCATCFGIDSQCAVKNCMLQCMSNPDSPSCLSCVQNNCFPALKECANVADDVLPPKRESEYNQVSYVADCNNPDDIAALKNHRTDFHGIAKDCAKKYWGSPAPTAQCIMTKTGNTLPCATCFGVDSQCAVKNCMLQCMSNPDSPGCLSCVQKNCFPALKKCANVPDDILPPKKESKYNQVSFVADCNNPDDIAAFKNHHTDFHGIAKDCAKMYWGSPAPTAQCIMAKTGNTLPCATCFGVDSHCAVKNCMLQCMSNPDSPGCLSCVQKNCFPALKKCANVPDDVLPPKKESEYNQVSYAADCNNPNDITAFKNHRTDFHGIAQNCARKYWRSPSPTSQTAQCIMVKTGNTLPCATCFGIDSQCAVKNCMLYCMSAPDTPGCLDCVEKNCFPALKKCANVADGVLPP